MDIAKNLLIGLALVVGAPWAIQAMWRPVPKLWSGTQRHVQIESGRFYRIHPRSYLTGILPPTALLAALTACGLQFLMFAGTRMDRDFFSWGPARAAAVLSVLAVPLTVLHWVVNAVNRPSSLVPPHLRAEVGWMTQWLRPAEVRTNRNMRRRTGRGAGQARTPNVR